MPRSIGKVKAYEKVWLRLWFVAFLCCSASPAVAQDRVYDFDAKSGYFYFQGGSPGLVDAEGRSSLLVPPYFPEVKASPLLGGPATRVFDSPWGVGLLVNNEEFWQYDAEGRVKKIHLFASGLVPCGQNGAATICSIVALNRLGSLYTVALIDSSLGLMVYYWNGQSFAPAPIPWHELDPSEIFLMNDSNTYLLDVGGAQLRISRYLAEGDEKASIMFKDRIQDFALPSSQLDLFIVDAHAVGNTAYALTSQTAESSLSGLLRISLNGEQVSLEQDKDLSSKMGGSFTWLGIDDGATAYAYRGADRSVFAYDLLSASTRDLGICDAGTSYPRLLGRMSRKKEKAIWLACNRTIYVLNRGLMQVKGTFEAEIQAGLVSSGSAEPLTALLDFPGQKILRVEKGVALKTEPIEMTLAGHVQGSALSWEDGNRFCRRGKKATLTPIEGVYCLTGDTWQEEKAHALPLPLDIMETEKFTWYVGRVDEQVKVWRRARKVESNWTLVHTEESLNPTQQIRFFPSAHADEVGLLGVGQHLIAIDREGRARSLAPLQQQFATFRPALSADGWVYGLAIKEAQLLELRSFDPEGRMYAHQTMRYLQFLSKVPHLIPLERGVLFASELSTWKVLYRERSIELSQMFGEFKPTEQQRMQLQAWSLGKGQALINKTMIETEGTENQFDQFTSYRFNGRTLEKVHARAETIEITDGFNFDFEMPSAFWSRFSQIWQGEDGLWRRPSLLKSELPLVVREDLYALFDNNDMNSNDLTAAGFHQGQKVFAGPLGLWFCDAEAGMRVSSESQGIDRVRGCDLHPLRLQVRQVISHGAGGLYLLAGQSLYHYRVETRQLKGVTSGLESPAVHRAGDALLYGRGTTLYRFDLNAHKEEKLRSLPSGVEAKAILALDEDYICAGEGLFERSGTSWEIRGQSCRAGLAAEGSFWSLADDYLWRCQNGECRKEASYRVDFRQKPVLGMSDGLIVGNGRQLLRLDAGQLRACSASWAQGPIPLSDVRRIDAGLVLMNKAGALSEACQANPEIFRFF